MKRRKLNYRFHNPNPVAVTANHILKIMLEANMGKVQEALQRAADIPPDNKEKLEEYSA